MKPIVKKILLVPLQVIGAVIGLTIAIFFVVEAWETGPMGNIEVRDAETGEVECSFWIMPWHFIEGLDDATERICGMEIE